MPNWSDNQLTITTNYENFKAIVDDLIVDGDFTFTKLCPLPFDDNDEWSVTDAIEAWGTKWDADTTPDSIEITEVTTAFTLNSGTISIRYMTAWDPPFQFLVKLIEKHTPDRYIFEGAEPDMQLGFYWDNETKPTTDLEEARERSEWIDGYYTTYEETFAED